MSVAWAAGKEKPSVSRGNRRFFDEGSPVGGEIDPEAVRGRAENAEGDRASGGDL